MIYTGTKNNITDVNGINVGNSNDLNLISGVTVIIPNKPCIAAYDCRGGAPGTRETDALNPENFIEKINAIVFSGGSAPGLEAANGVSDWLIKKGKGLSVGQGEIIPIVPAAVIFDINNGGNREKKNSHTYYDLGFTAASKILNDTKLGNIGAGTGAKSGKLKGGLGSASLQNDKGMIVGSLSIVNSFGEVTMPNRPEFWSWPFEKNKEFGGLGGPQIKDEFELDFSYDKDTFINGNTTLNVVATNINLNRSQALRIAIMAQDGLARAIRPVHTPFDGDIVFVLSTSEKKLPNLSPHEITQIGMMAADCISRSIARGVYEARDLGKLKSYRTLFKI